MSKGRLEAFSDGVLAIIITIMVLELAVPHEATPEALIPVLPTLLSYLLSFVYLGIYWNNHHHLLQAVKHVDGSVLWANLHLLFWLSLVPFTKGSTLSETVGSDAKGKASILVYLVAIALAFVSAPLSYALYALVAVLWLVPDRRIEKRLAG